jgi:hypothetical protein
VSQPPFLRLPSFLLIGTRKSGTTWLDKALRLTPPLWLPPDTKEVSFFDQRYSRGFDWYAAHFQDADPNAICGECSPTYWSAPDVPERVRSLLPQVKLVTILRDPVERAWSAYLHLWRAGRIPRQLGFWHTSSLYPDILSDGLYDHHLARWRQYFPASQLRIMVAEDVWGEPDRYLTLLTEWLGAPAPAAQPPPIGRSRTELPRSHLLSHYATGTVRWLRARDIHSPVNIGKALGLQRLIFKRTRPRSVYLAQPTPDLRGELRDYYSGTVQLTSQLLGRDLGSLWWGE